MSCTLCKKNLSINQDIKQVLFSAMLCDAVELYHVVRRCRPHTDENVHRLCVCEYTTCHQAPQTSNSKLNTPLMQQGLQKFSTLWKVLGQFLISSSFLNTFDLTDVVIYS